MAFASTTAPYNSPYGEHPSKATIHIVRDDAMGHFDGYAPMRPASVAIRDPVDAGISALRGAPQTIRDTYNSELRERQNELGYVRPVDAVKAVGEGFEAAVDDFKKSVTNALPLESRGIWTSDEEESRGGSKAKTQRRRAGGAVGAAHANSKTAGAPAGARQQLAKTGGRHAGEVMALPPPGGMVHPSWVDIKHKRYVPVEFRIQHTVRANGNALHSDNGELATFGISENAVVRTVHNALSAAWINQYTAGLDHDFKKMFGLAVSSKIVVHYAAAKHCPFPWGVVALNDPSNHINRWTWCGPGGTQLAFAVGAHQKLKERKVRLMDLAQRAHIMNVKVSTEQDILDAHAKLAGHRETEFGNDGEAYYSVKVINDQGRPNMFYGHLKEDSAFNPQLYPIVEGHIHRVPESFVKSASARYAAAHTRYVQRPPLSHGAYFKFVRVSDTGVGLGASGGRVDSDLVNWNNVSGLGNLDWSPHDTPMEFMVDFTIHFHIREP